MQNEVTSTENGVFITKEQLIQTVSNMIGDRFKPGVDDMTASECLEYILVNGESVITELQLGKYQPKPALLFTVLNKNGKERDVCKLSAIDMAIEKAFLSVITPIVEETFSCYSFAFRTGYGRNVALAAYIALAQKNRWVAKIDIKNCYDSISKEKLLPVLQKKIDDDVLVNALIILAYATVIDENGVNQNTGGILQGAPLSPILCNLYLDECDKYLENQEISFCRYADDIVIFGHSENDVIKKLGVAVDYISSVLQLSINNEKTKIVEATDLEYLGYVFDKTEDGIVFAGEKKEKEIQFHNRWVHEYGQTNNKRINILSNGILSKKDMSLLFEGDTNTVIPIGSIEQINIYSSVTIAPNTLQLLYQNGVSVNVFDRYGHLLGRFLPEKEMTDVSIPLKQLEAYRHSKGARRKIARNILLSSLHNIRLNIRYYKKTYDSVVCNDALAKIKLIEKQIIKSESIEEMMLLEARMRECYYSCFNEMIKNNSFVFTKRSKRPPMDEINSLISFGNTFLYNYIAMEINKTPLDIRVGFLHSTNKRRESLNLDIADIFKPLIVDRTVFTLINRRMISVDEHFQREQNGAVYLNKEGKKLLIAALYEKLSAELSVDGIPTKYSTIITEDIREFCRCLKKGKIYKGFRQVR